MKLGLGSRVVAEREPSPPLPKVTLTAAERAQLAAWFPPPANDTERKR